MKKVFVAWQNPRDRRWSPVGILTVDESGNHRFVYTKGARMSGFVPFEGMQDLKDVYESQYLFPVFENRLLRDSRPEYGRFLKWLNIRENEDNPLDVLGMTEGIRATDTLEVFKCPTPNLKGEYEVDFFIHGLRYIAGPAIDRVNRLAQGERLCLVPDVQNKHDPKAMGLRTEDPVELVGYCPRYLSPDFTRLLEVNRPLDMKIRVERLNRDAPLNLRLRCKLVSPWPRGFNPCSDEAFEPLAGPEELSGHIAVNHPVPG